ncbi:hypothetical protein Bpfe_012840 [Biomphalaria pfeifferi]|uniref:Uncharacterized protein n=1 Tax=Biomphalaria pfeifferi TaxID=112525 RepID=A0AAD8BN45_BIOPF|nr:hypothetical protein Bpfe_012840 [Biomphalaria pfeifferi]
MSGNIMSSMAAHTPTVGHSWSPLDELWLVISLTHVLAPWIFTGLYVILKDLEAVLALLQGTNESLIQTKKLALSF